MECNKDLVKVFEEMHKLKLENEKLDKENKNLKIALDNKAKEFFESEDNCIYSYINNNILGSTVQYRIFNPTADVDANIRALLKDGGVDIMRSIHTMDGNSVLCVKVDGIKYYSNPYCDDALGELRRLEGKIAEANKVLQEIKDQGSWLGNRDSGRIKCLKDRLRYMLKEF